MKKQDLRKLQQFARVVGEFIRHWGFRNIHGEIWSVLYLSQNPLAAVEIASMLDVSKALVSPALQELLAEGLIAPAPSENAKIKRYAAVEDVVAVIRDVLRRREQKMIAEASERFAALEPVLREEDSLNPSRVEKLGCMIGSAQLALSALVEADELWMG